jgi:predicted PurR-regulated permease PerM
MVDGKNIGEYTYILLAAIVLILAFLVIRPIAMSIITGLLLAYVLYPVYTRLLKWIKSKNATSLIVCISLLIIVIIPSWFLLPMLAKQMFEAYTFLQKADIMGVLHRLVPSLDISPNLYATISNFINTIATSLVTSTTSFILDFPTILLNVTVVFFILFFALRDWEELRNYVKSLSPLSHEAEDLFYNKFKDVTNSVIFGHVIVGVIQGLVAGLGYLIFGVSSILSLTILSILFGIIPVAGPFVIWVPVVIALFIQGKTAAAVGLLVYGLLVVSTVDNFLRPVIVSKRAKINTGIILVGTIGGLFVFGVLGLVLGPLILAYAMIILEIYRNKKR